MDSASIAIIEHFSAVYGVPAWVSLCIAYAETSINPGEIGDNGTSYGLFQLHTPGGQGDVWPQYGSSPQVLLNPTTNAMIAIKPIAAGYKEALAQGLSGFAALQYTADHSGHPDSTGYMPSSYLSRLNLAWGVAQQQGWLSGAGASTGGTIYAGALPSTLQCSAQTLQALGSYVGEGSAAGAQAGLYVFARTANGQTIHTVVNESCGVVATYVLTPKPASMNLPPSIKAAVASVPTWLWPVIGITTLSGLGYYAYKRGWVNSATFDRYL